MIKLVHTFCYHFDNFKFEFFCVRLVLALIPKSNTFANIEFYINNYATPLYENRNTRISLLAKNSQFILVKIFEYLILFCLILQKSLNEQKHCRQDNRFGRCLKLEDFEYYGNILISNFIHLCNIS